MLGCAAWCQVADRRRRRWVWASVRWRSIGIGPLRQQPIERVGNGARSSNESLVAQPVRFLHREQRQQRDALAEPDVSFTVTAAAAEAHFVRDHDGEVKPA